MFEKKRLHPISIFSYVAKQWRDMLLPLFMAVVLKAREVSMVWNIAVPAVALFYTTLAGFFTWLRFTYQINDEELYIEQGIFIRQKSSIPFERIQGISLSIGFFQRLAGVVQVHIETAGNELGKAEAVLTAVTKEEAEQIAQQIRRAKEKGGSAEAISPISGSELSDDIAFSLRFRDVFLLSATSGGVFGALAAISAFISQLDDFISYDVLYRDMQGVIRNALDGALALVVLFLVAYALSVGRHLLRYAFFTVRNQKETIGISRGLFEKQLLTVSKKRVQGMIIKENVIQRLLGYVSVHMIHAGGSLDGGENGSIVLCPFVKKERAVSVIAACFPEYCIHQQFQPLPQRARVRYMLRPVYVLAIPISPLAYFFQPWGIGLLLLLPLASYLGYKSYRMAGWTISGEQLALRNGMFRIETMYTRKYCIQSIATSATWFQKRKQLRTLAVAVMPRMFFKVTDVDEKEAEAVYMWVR
ncbi:PH domain-containing protein [Anoxybacteroides amylolyticum]|uniref:Bacterial PH domain protein n=1 Tax=Anoxybacteroides amylolyticum TaxID=294699 RepID=A0A160F356_9BACL|nr:PH domain-containing protein [Anoxybacillus amylolyticus]ANB60727.1 bacterial PH domain protein [Anoxybacillus amylolyticus]